MKKISIIILFLSLFILAGCDDTNNTSDGKKTNTGTMVHKHCIREGSVTDGEVSLNYDLYYTGDVLNFLKSEEKITSTSSDVLDTYEEAYKTIHYKYKGLTYYDTNVVRDENSVTSTISIDYDDIDIDKLLSIEGEEDNIFENKIPKVDKWLSLAKKFGTKCTIVED